MKERAAGYFLGKQFACCVIAEGAFFEDWLPNDVRAPTRILAIDYASSLMQLTGTLETLTVRSQKFLHELQEAGVGNRPLVFVCHSMGKGFFTFSQLIFFAADPLFSRGC